MNLLRHRLPFVPARLLAFALLLGWLSGCATTPVASTGSREPSWVALQRTAPERSEAPAYRVTLFEDGRVLFEGYSGVKSKGSFSRRIPADQAAAVFRRLEAVNIWDREPRYDVDRINRGGDSVIVSVAPTDAAWDILTLRHLGRFKRIDGLFFAPHELRDLKTLIEQSVGLADWVNSTPERDP